MQRTALRRAVEDATFPKVLNFDRNQFGTRDGPAAFEEPRRSTQARVIERVANTRSALSALKPKTFPMIDEVRFAIEPSSKRSRSYAMSTL